MWFIDFLDDLTCLVAGGHNGTHLFHVKNGFNISVDNNTIEAYRLDKIDKDLYFLW
jgi:hypothetical protein